jgi:protein phosphatase 1 regulatory subunit 7
MNDNRIPNLHALERELDKTDSLETIYLEGNPCQRNDEGGYRRKVMLALPQVKQIDAT